MSHCCNSSSGNGKAKKRAGETLKNAAKRPALRDISNTVSQPAGEADVRRLGDGCVQVHHLACDEEMKSPSSPLARMNIAERSTTDCRKENVKANFVEKDACTPIPCHSLPKHEDLFMSFANEEVINIDAGREQSATHCTTYVQEVYEYLRENELRYRPQVLDFLKEVQKEINPEMRAILFDWLVDVAEEYQLSTETIFLAKNYIDRFLALRVVNKANLQLVGLSCILIAAKFEEVFPPAVDDFVYISDNAYQRQDIIDMEHNVLTTLGYNLAAATEKNFLRRYQRASAASIDNRTSLSLLSHLSNYLTELTMLDYSFVAYSPSMIATSAVVVALRALDLPPWSPTLEYYTQQKITDPQLQKCVNQLSVLYKSAKTRPTLRAVQEKYSHQRFLQISTKQTSLS